MRTAQTPETFLPLKQAASQLGVPAAWLRREALAGRVPCLRARRRLLFNLAAAEAALLARSREGVNHDG
jgi:hypothetical protein